MKKESMKNVEYAKNLRLEMIFSTFREKEKIKKGPLTETFQFSAMDIYRVLCNRCHKKYLGIETSDLEEVIAEEAGKLIRAYVKRNYNESLEQLKELGKEIQADIPYPKYDITLEDLQNRLDNFARSKGKKDSRIINKKR